MKTAIIIIIIICVLYGFGAFNEKPADKPAPIRRNRSEEDRNTLSAWMQTVDDWEQIAADANDTELAQELHSLYSDMDAANRYGHSAKEISDFRHRVKCCYKSISMIQQPD